MSYKFDSIVNKNEANALKEMIFQRVRARSESMGEEAQNDIMDMARESFVSKDNPFSQIVSNAQKAVDAEPKVDEQEVNVKKAEQKENIGFPQREPKARAVEQKRVLEEHITTVEIQNNMAEARESLTNKKSFMGALNFLNSQAAVSLMRTRDDKFEVVI